MRFSWVCLLAVVSVFAMEAAEGPVYVPVGNWVYPALQKLAALGYIHGQPSNI